MGKLKWKIIRVVSKGNYNYAVVPDHPNSTKNGYVLEHRIKMENKIGRLLLSEEIVHHKNKNKKDNRLSNLQLMDRKKHTKKHQLEKGRKWVKLMCPWCQQIFCKPHNQTHLAKGGVFTSCCRKHNGHFSMATKVGSIIKMSNEEIKKRLKRNVLREFIKYIK